MLIRVTKVAISDYEKGIFDITLESGGHSLAQSKDDLLQKLKKCKERDSDFEGLKALIGETLDI